MPIISKQPSVKKEKITIEINEDVLNKIKQYCAWAGINDISFFVEESAKIIFDKDKKFKSEFRTSKRGRKKKIN